MATVAVPYFTRNAHGTSFSETTSWHKPQDLGTGVPAPVVVNLDKAPNRALFKMVEGTLNGPRAEAAVTALRREAALIIFENTKVFHDKPTPRPTVLHTIGQIATGRFNEAITDRKAVAAVVQAIGRTYDAALNEPRSYDVKARQQTQEKILSGGFDAVLKGLSLGGTKNIVNQRQPILAELYPTYSQPLVARVAEAAGIQHVQMTHTQIVLGAIPAQRHVQLVQRPAAIPQAASAPQAVAG